VTRVHRLRVAEVITETHDACSLVFDLEPQQRPHFAYRPGQFLTVRIPGPGKSAARCYSLASSPDTDARLKVTVKRVDGGHGSNWLCDNVRSGTEIDVLEPSGVFTPHSFDADHLLFAGGSGITPIMSILKSLLARGSGRAFLCYANRDEDSVIFKTELKRLQHEHPERLVVLHWLESVQGLPTVPALRAFAAGLGCAEAFVCGPKPFMVAVREALGELGFPRSGIHLERFNSLSGNPFDVAEAAPAEEDEGDGMAAVSVEMDGERHEFPWPRGKRLLDVLREQGIDAPASCSEGVCASCECRVVEGEVSMVANQVLEEDDLADGYVLACQALPITDRVRIRYE
jgi:3-ketosteroid 9alpha-monooxygenase subunit B